MRPVLTSARQAGTCSTIPIITVIFFGVAVYSLCKIMVVINLIAGKYQRKACSVWPLLTSLHVLLLLLLLVVIAGKFQQKSSFSSAAASKPPCVAKKGEVHDSIRFNAERSKSFKRSIPGYNLYLLSCVVPVQLSQICTPYNFLSFVIFLKYDDCSV